MVRKLTKVRGGNTAAFKVCSLFALYVVFLLKHHRRMESCLLLAAQPRRAVNTGPLAPVRIQFAPGLGGLCRASQRRASVKTATLPG